MKKPKDIEIYKKTDSVVMLKKSLYALVLIILIAVIFEFQELFYFWLGFLVSIGIAIISMLLALLIKKKENYYYEED